MSEHTISEAESRLSDLIDRAIAGEGIVITREGRPAVELKPVAKSGRPVTPLDLDWLRQKRVGSRPASEDAGTFVSGIRDEEER